jgi:cytoskeletal protein CcmA (bactofilin family)
MDRIAAVGSSVVIKGELSAREDVVIAGRVEGTISVEGELSAPRIAIAEGATLCGRVETSTRSTAQLKVAS